MEICRNYVPNKITIISNITVLVSHCICFRYFMPMSHDVNKKASSIVSPHPSLYQVFTRLVVLQEILYQSSFALIRLLQKIMHFQSKTIFFYQLIAGWFWFCFFMYVFLRELFHSSAIIAEHSYMHSFLCLASHQIMWHDKRIYGDGLKITIFCFFGFRGN